MGVHALFPISVSNRVFSTENIREALSAMPDRVTEVTFLIADWLQLYNRASNCNESVGLGAIIRDYSDRNKDLVNRQRWIAKFLDTYPDTISASVKVVGMDHYFDGAYANTFRNVNILFSVDMGFRNDVISAAQRFLENSNRKRKSHLAASLSEQYILEEIALNIRIRVKELVEEEYYLGDYHKPMLKVYRNCYSANPLDLLGGEVQQERNYRFFSLGGDSKRNWMEVGKTC